MPASQSNRATGVAGCAAVAAALTALVPGAAGAELSPAARRADTLVVTGLREQRSAEVPRSLSVTTRDDIERLPAVNLVDLLARAANLNLRSTLGNAKFSGVDIRGQGDTYTSNVLVMVDGIRLNAPDLSGADLSIIPVDLVERIEVIRGANTVRYGNGAVGGVINIITRKPAAGGEAGVRGRLGSFAARGWGADAAWGSERWSAALAGEFNAADGYRDNSELRQSDLRARLGYAPVDWFTAAVGALLHDDTYGLPGPLTGAEFAGGDAARRQSRFPFDGGATDDDVLRADATLGTAATGELRVVAFDRQRSNRFRIGAPSAAAPFGEIDEDTQRVDARFERNLQLGGRQHSLILGFDGNNSRYGRREGELTAAGTAVKQGYLAQRGWFAAADLQLGSALQAAIGYRQDSLRIDGRDGIVVTDLCDDVLVIGSGQNTVTLCNDPGGPRTGVSVDRAASDSWRNSAVEAGLVFAPGGGTTVFLAYAESFRNPNVDELVLAAANLGPQTSRHWDAGIRYAAGAALELGFAVFSSDTRDEILFFVPPFIPGSPAGGDPAASLGLNRNADDVVERVGAEADVRWTAASWLELSGNVGYTRARFAGSDARLPLVPEWTAGTTAVLTLAEGYSLSVAGSYVGSRPDGNDFSNTRFATVAPYFVADAKLSWERDGFSLYAGIANVFDEVYAASVYNEQFYPQAPRNIYAGFSYRIQSPG